MKRGSILLIDDNKAEIRLLNEAFSKTKFPRELVTFTEAEAAYHYIVHNVTSIFIIISDINMPGMSGPDLLEKINQNPDLKMLAIPFIFISNSDDQKDIERAYSLSAQGYFQKPYLLNEMTDLFNVIISYWTAARIPRNKHYYIH